jgi:UDP-2,3-diacylglucosamine pyrophosphatase LpxH
MNLGALKLRLEHGDETNPEDKLYRFQRWVLRSWLIETMCHHAPGGLVRFIGETWSGTSRKKRPYVNQAVKERARQFAEQKAQEDFFDLMICGHIHMRDDHSFETGAKKSRYINLGTWLAQPATLEITKDTIQFIELT